METVIVSVENALQFLARARRSAELRRRLSAFKGREALAGLVGLAAELGLVFSEEEYRRAVVLAAEGELDTEALNGALDEMGLSRIPEGNGSGGV